MLILLTCHGKTGCEAVVEEVDHSPGPEDLPREAQPGKTEAEADEENGHIFHTDREGNHSGIFTDHCNV